MRNSGIDGSSPLALLMNMIANPRLIAVSGTGGAVNATSTLRFSRAASQVGPAPIGNDVDVLLRVVARFANHERGEVRGQGAGIRHADGQPFERFDFFRQRHGFGDAFGLGRLFMHRPVDKQLCSGRSSTMSSFLPS